jgi:hypothetical protein
MPAASKVGTHALQKKAFPAPSVSSGTVFFASMLFRNPPEPAALGAGDKSKILFPLVLNPFIL